MKKKTVHIALSLSLLAGASPAFGETDQDKLKDINQEIHNIQQTAKQKESEAKNLENNIVEINQKQSIIQQDVESLDLKIAETEGKISELNQKVGETQIRLDESNQELKKSEEELKLAEEKVKSRNELLKRRVKAMYEQGEISYLEVLLDSESIGTFLERLYAIKLIIQQDEKILEENIEDRNLVEEKKKKVEENKRLIETALSELETMTHQSNLLKDSLAEQKEQKKQTLQVLEKEEGHLEEIKEEHEQALLALADQVRAKLSQKREVENEIERKKREEEERKREEERRRDEEKKKKGEEESNNQHSSLNSSEQIQSFNGKFLWPVPSGGTITSYFGGRVDPFTGKSAGHNGMDIAAPEGTDIVAAEDGIVIVSGYAGGFGNCIMIDHGGKVSTLYGHIRNGGLLVSVGEKVSKGQKIAEIGSTGRSTGNHLHFTVYVNNQAVDPMGYLK